MTAQQSGKQLLKELEAFCGKFASEYLADHSAYIEQPGVLATSAKEVNDAIWGTIKLRPLEVAVLDSPLLQRLRFIRQLGVVHWTYPGAIHTRFEHTLGVLHQVQQLIAAINDAAPAGKAPIDETYASILRLTALIHDVGHGVFSHVSEHALMRSDAIRSALTIFAREQKIDKVQLSELVAYFIVGSGTFVKFLAKLIAMLPNDIRLGTAPAATAATVSSKMQNAIIGKSISDSVPLMHELISGPLDGDKLDYFVRDARMAGIPVVLDISRLTQKVTVELLTQQELPRPIGSRVAGGHATYALFGLKWSGAAVLDELHLARILLYAKIYRHQKVLAAEAMIEALFETLLRRNDMPAIDLIRLSYSITDDQMLWASPAHVLSLAGIEDSSKDADAKFIGDVLFRLRSRRLYVKALAVRATYPGDLWSDLPEQKTGLQRLVEDFANPIASRAFRDHLVAEVQKVVELVPKAVPDGYDPALIEQSIVVVAKSRMAGGTEIDRSFIFHAGKPVTYRDLSGVNRHAWADAYDFSTAPGIVFCPREIASATYAAAERIIREKYGVVLPTSAMELSKQDEKLVHELKIKLMESDYYRRLPFDLRPRPARLDRADISGFLTEMTQKLEALDEAPMHEGSERRPSTLRGRIEYWLSQFQTDEMIDCAMASLRALKVLGREDTRRALRAFVSKHPEFKGATILILGSQKDSSSVQGYYSQDVTDIFPRVMTVEEAAQKKIETPVVFLDDIIGSGGQVQDVLGNWFEDESLKKDELGEQRDLFGEAEREYLRARRIGFVFVAGWAEGVKAAREACEQLKLNAEVYAHLDDDHIPFAFEGVLDELDPDTVAQFKAFCRDLGEKMLLNAGKDAETAKQRSLGYGNRAMLMISRYNVPTQVLTCLWRGGDTGDFIWHPLVHRRTKK